MTTYKCSWCNKPVTVTAEKVERPCGCEAPIIANIQAVARGAGGVK